jgi:oligopeptide transport system substrate-binding protein
MSIRAAMPWAAPLFLLGGLLAAPLALGPGTRRERADFVFNNGAEIASLDPARATGVPEGRVLRAIYEGLLLKSPVTLQPMPGMAESWDQSPDGRQFTFHLREAYWTNGDPVTAHDFAFSFRRALTPETGCQYAEQLHCIEGAREFHTAHDPEGAEWQWSQVAILPTDERTLLIRLVQPTPWFLHLMSFYAFYPVNARNLREARQRWPDTWEAEWLRPEHLVTNGPFRISERRVNDRIRLVKSASYWDADHVAFETIDVLAVEHSSTALAMYLKGDIDWLDGTIPTNLVLQLRLREDFINRPYLGTYFYRFNTTKPPYDDARVRRALSLLVPRREICLEVLKAGQFPLASLVPGRVGDYVPPQPKQRPEGVEAEDSFDFDAFGTLAGRTEEEQRARRLRSQALRLLQEAGYGKARPLPPIVIYYNTGALHRDIAEIIGRTWETQLDVEVRYRNQEWRVFLDAQRRLEHELSRSSWFGDYPDPHSFLQVFTSDDPNNRTGWKSPEYDRLVLESEREVDPVRRLALLHQAEELLLEESPIIPIYAYITQNLVNPRLGGFENNLLNEQYPKLWYWKDDLELEKTRLGNLPGVRKVPAPGPGLGLYSPAEERRRAAR